MANVLNARFAAGKASTDLAQTGVVYHTFDGYEGTPAWKAKPHNGGQASGFISTSIMYAGMRAREDRINIPLPSYDGGLIVRPTAVTVACAYPQDGESANINFGDHPGCREMVYCSRGEACATPTGTIMESHPPERKAQPFRAADLDVMLQKYQMDGPAWTLPGWFSGYNEVVIDSEVWNGNLPHAVEAFFVLGDEKETWQDVREVGEHPFGRHATWEDRVGYVEQAHSDFLEAYGLSSDDVPMVRLDPRNWERPFIPHTGEGGKTWR